MGRQPGFFDMADRLQQLSAKGDDLERIAAERAAFGWLEGRSPCVRPGC